MGLNGYFQRVRARLFGLRSPRLSDLPIRPTWITHPLTEHVGRGRAWYVLVVPTLHEGHLAGRDLVAALSDQRADLSVILVHFADDPTAQGLRQAQEQDDRIAVLAVQSPNHSWTAMDDAIDVAVTRLVAEQGRKPNDVMRVSLAELIARRANRRGGR